MVKRNGLPVTGSGRFSAAAHEAQEAKRGTEEPSSGRYRNSTDTIQRQSTGPVEDTCVERAAQQTAGERKSRSDNDLSSCDSSVLAGSKIHVNRAL